MCGIAGIIHLDGQPVEEEPLARMTRSLSHRGPDGQGLRVTGAVGLGHRRLSIIDPAAGAQPMSNEDGSIWVTFNGEIYNYLELQRVLESKGHRFHTSCDTEVIVHAYEEWGEKCVEQFRGMFAFAVHDERNHVVFVARDRLGVKPLVYSLEENRLAFASELQSLETLSDLRLRMNWDALNLYLQLQYVPAPQTIYRNIWKLEPGCTLTVRNGKVGEPQRYWDVSPEVEHGKSEAQWLEELDATLRESVRLRLRSDVPFGAFLSGGVDSSLITAYMSQMLDKPVRTFSIGFDEIEYSELPYARQAAHLCGSIHHEEIVRPQALEILPLLVRHYGEPFGDCSAVPTYYVSQLARQNVKMVLSGDGADESFGGYGRYVQIAMMNAPGLRGMMRRGKRLAGNAARLAGVLPPLLPVNTPLEMWLTHMTITPPDDLRSLVAGGPVSSDNPPAYLVEAFKTPRNWENQGWLHYFDLKNYLPYAILTKVDIASMCHGLEVRGPLLDHHVVELACRIPARFKVAYDENGQMQGKSLIKKLARRFYPRDFVDRPKMGFGIPIDRWFQGVQLDQMHEQLQESSGRLPEIFDRQTLTNLVAAQKQTGDKFYVLWLLLFLSEWFRQHPRVEL